MVEGPLFQPFAVSRSRKENQIIDNSDRKRFLQIASGSARESAAILDVLVACQDIPAERCQQGKEFLDRIVAMLVRMTRRQQEECCDFSRSG